MLRSTPVLIILVSLVSVAPPPDEHDDERGRVERHVEIVYYAVEGDTSGALTQHLRERGPSYDGGRYFGKTAWTISAEYVWEGDQDGCRVQEPIVRVDITITLPRWDPPAEAAPALVVAWEDFARALAAHEHNHRRLAEEAAEAIRSELATTRFSSCRNADERARARVAAIIDEYSRRNRAYDRHTRHGSTEGAVWPPPRRIGAAGVHQRPARRWIR